ncbi:MAG TPA: ABC transporter ATP-binding protein [Spirillospora sp.]|nr:ABC transporter ATP-binding protein [Spirillospora sp.]
MFTLRNRAVEDGSRVAEAVELAGVHKEYATEAGTVRALAGVSATFAAGTFTAVMGPSGSGKSTLLQCAAGLDTVTSGEVRVAGVPLRELSANALTILRRDRIGFVFQAFNLIPSLTARQNIELPRRLAGRPAPPGEVDAVLAAVGLADRAGHRPSELSGGQQQRVAIARALVTRPDVVFADEPTGALDSATSREVLRLLREVVDGSGLTVVMVTHDPRAAAHADRVLFLADGRISGELADPTADRVAARLAAMEDAK